MIALLLQVVVTTSTIAVYGMRAFGTSETLLARVGSWDYADELLVDIWGYHDWKMREAYNMQNLYPQT